MSLWEAIQSNDTEMVRKTLSTGVNINEQNALGQTYLMSALQHKRATIADMLLKVSDINLLDNQGRNAMFYVQSLSQAKKLIRAKIDINTTDTKGNSATDIIQYPKITAFIDEQRQKIQSQLELAIRKNESRKTRDLLKMGADVNWRYGRYKETALIIASRLCREEIVDILIKAGADVNAKDIHNWTALSSSVEGVYPSLINKLLDAGATFDDPDTVVACAIFGSMDTLRIMAKIGANFDSQDKKGMTIFMYEVKNGDIVKVQFLMENNVNPLLKNNDGKSGLDIALSKMHSSNFISTIQKYTEHWEMKERAKNNDKFCADFDVNFM